jgi:predicted transcriptional regulator
MAEQPATTEASEGGLLPFRPDIEVPDRRPEVVDLDNGAQVFEVLSTDTTREILSELYSNPGTTSDIADKVNTSLQNTGYHLQKLRDAGLVSVIGTWYSSRGVEMDVYGPTKEPLVLVAGDRSSTQAVTELFVEPATSERETGS